MNDKDTKFERFRRIMYGEGYTVTGVYDNFMCTLEDVLGRPDMPRITMRFDIDGLFIRKGNGPYEFDSALRPEAFVDLVVDKGILSARPF